MTGSGARLSYSSLSSQAGGSFRVPYWSGWSKKCNKNWKSRGIDFWVRMITCSQGLHRRWYSVLTTRCWRACKINHQKFLIVWFHMVSSRFILVCYFWDSKSPIYCKGRIDAISHVLTAASKFLWAFNVKSYSTKLSDNFQWKCKISFPCGHWTRLNSLLGYNLITKSRDHQKWDFETPVS